MAHEGPMKVIYSYSNDSEMEQTGQSGYPQWKRTNEQEGLDACDIDGDGITDIVGGGRWFKYDGQGGFTENIIDAIDFNRDGHLDIFSGEMGVGGGNPEAKIRILLGDGSGNFIHHLVATGIGTHESRITDLDGDGDYDILSKPYTWKAPRLDLFINESR